MRVEIIQKKMGEDKKNSSCQEEGALNLLDSIDLNANKTQEK